MRKRDVFLCVLAGMAGGAFGLVSLPFAHAEAGAANEPSKRGKVADATVIVELFTSEGCSSCPPADGVLARLEESQPVLGARVVPLEFHVDYWDELGWPDPFATPSFTERQRKYATLEGRLYTPQAVVDGRTELVGSNASALERAIAQAAPRPHASIEIGCERKDLSVEVTVHVGPLPASAEHSSSEASVLVTLTQSRATMRVLRGENGGRTLDHTAVVRELETAGMVSLRGGDARATLRLPAGIPTEQLRVVAFAQRARDRQIVGSATRPLAR